MNWPWVSRARLEDAERVNAWLKSEIANQSARHDTQVREWRDAFDGVLDKFTALRLVGGAVPEPKEPAAPKAVPDPVVQAIIARSGNSRLLRKHYNEFVREQRALNVDDADIAKAILDGESSAADEGVPA